jgi:Ubiquitin-binding domain
MAVAMPKFSPFLATEWPCTNSPFHGGMHRLQYVDASTTKLSGHTSDAYFVQAKRAEFWDTQPSYGGSQDIWSAIKTALECDDMGTMQVYLQAADVKPANNNLTAFYDSRGFLYEIPEWAVSDPVDLH